MLATSDGAPVSSPVAKMDRPRPIDCRSIRLIGRSYPRGSPHLGQGAATAIEDAILAAELFETAANIPAAILPDPVGCIDFTPAEESLANAINAVSVDNR